MTDALEFVADELVSNDLDAMPHFAGVYAIRNRVTDGMYVGATKNLRFRWRAHGSALRERRHPDPLLQTAWNAHGPQAFEIVLMEAATSPPKMYGLDPALRLAERRWQIALLDRGVELYNRTLLKLLFPPIVTWDAETMLPRVDE